MFTGSMLSENAVAALPALWRMSWPCGLLFAALGAAQLGNAIALLAHPVRRRILLLAAAGANAVVVVWGVALLDMVSLPDPSFL